MDQERTKQLKAKLHELALHFVPSPKRSGMFRRNDDSVAGQVRIFFNEIQNLRDAGWSYGDIATLFNKAQIPLPNGKVWKTGGLRLAFWKESKLRSSSYPPSNFPS